MQYSIACKIIRLTTSIPISAFQFNLRVIGETKLVGDFGVLHNRHGPASELRIPRIRWRVRCGTSISLFFYAL